MFEPEVVLNVDKLGKRYVLGGLEGFSNSFREMLIDLVFAPFRRFKKLSGNADESELFWALNDINFSVKKGEVVGIVGKNGAGKSTLLKILSRITTPTEGSVTIKGKVASLLEVGTGFHPELTGRENIYLNGAILGMKRKEITEKFNDIVEFANIEKFVDTPVKRYSSGMYVRLAFSVAAHLDPDILIVDEVLAVGDAHFQSKCLGKLDEVSRDGRTVIFVSHNMDSINRLCSRVILLENGAVKHDGEPREVIEQYLSGPFAAATNEFIRVDQHNRIETGLARINKLEVLAADFKPKMKFKFYQDFKLRINCHVSDDVNRAYCWFIIYDHFGKDIFSVFQYDDINDQGLSSGDHQLDIDLSPNLLLPGQYKISVGMTEIDQYDGRKLIDWAEFLGYFEILAYDSDERAFDGRLGMISQKMNWVKS